MGLDVGSKTIGIAISDPLGLTAQALEVWRRKSRTADVGRIVSLCDQYDVAGIVVGDPRRTDGAVGPEAERVRAFARELEEASGRAVVLWDERFTTKIAQQALTEGGLRRAKRREVVDMVAAALILQSYLDRKDDHP